MGKFVFVVYMAGSICYLSGLTFLSQLFAGLTEVMVPIHYLRKRIGDPAVESLSQ